MKNYKNQGKRRGAIITLVVLILLGVTVFALEKLGVTNFYQREAEQSQQSTTNATGSINYDPPTEQEKAETEQHKRNLDTQKSSNGDEKVPSGVTPIITSADQTTVRAYVSGIVEDGGTCTATFSQGQYSFTKSSEAFRDSSSTVCTPITMNRSDFAVGGEWTVSLKYVSTLVQGVSQEVRFKVE